MNRIGFGNDIHRLVEGRPLILGGVRIESAVGAEGHSDADALMHAVTDAVLGALALGDIGTHFPNSDERWRGAESSRFLKFAIAEAMRLGYSISNLDSTVSLERPKLRPYVDQIRENLSRLLEVPVDRISVKAKSGEGMDAVGLGAAIRAEAIVLLEEV